MKNISFTEFRKNASSLFSRVEEGEAIYVTRHGKPIAEVIPVREARNKTPSWKKKRIRKTIRGEALSSMIIKERESGE